MACARLILPLIAVLLSCLPAVAAGDGEALAVLHGRVVDMAARPAAGAVVRAFSSGDVRRPADFATAPVGPDGAYRLLLPAGRYWLVAVVRSDGQRYGPLGPRDRHSGSPQVVDLVPGDDLELDFTVMTLKEAALREARRNQTLVRLSGRILGPDGVPVPLACALADRRARPSGIPAHVSAWSGPDGGYVLYLPKGMVHLGASLGFPPESGYFLPLEIEADRDMSGVDLKLPEARGDGGAGSGPEPAGRQGGRGG